MFSTSRFFACKLKFGNFAHSRCFSQIAPKEKFKKVGIVGMGLMGHGVAQVVAQTGYRVLAIETAEAALKSGMKKIEGSITKVVSKDNSVPEANKATKIQEIISRIEPTTDITLAKDCDLIIEAIAENMNIKLSFYNSLGSIAKPGCVFASNTSSLPITSMAVVSKRPELFIGLHFFNPVQLMKLVEVVRTEHTSDATYQAVMAFVADIGKQAVTCPDTPGFIVNRLLVPYLAQAMALVDRKIATVPDIDISMQLGAGHPMGPLQLADYIGLDICHNILKGWVKDYPSELSFFIPHCLTQLVKDGNLGRKSGKGFYNWEGDKRGAPNL